MPGAVNQTSRDGLPEIKFVDHIDNAVSPVISQPLTLARSRNQINLTVSAQLANRADGLHVAVMGAQPVVEKDDIEGLFPEFSERLIESVCGHKRTVRAQGFIKIE